MKNPSLYSTHSLPILTDQILRIIRSFHFNSPNYEPAQAQPIPVKRDVEKRLAALQRANEKVRNWEFIWNMNYACKLKIPILSPVQDWNIQAYREKNRGI